MIGVAATPPAGLLMYTDRGSQYASEIHRRLLEDYQIIQSISRKGNCWDKSAIESFFKTLMVELVYQQRCAAPTQARLEIVSQIEGFYNAQRPHSSIGTMAPINAE